MHLTAPSPLWNFFHSLPHQLKLCGIRNGKNHERFSGKVDPLKKRVLGMTCRADRRESGPGTRPHRGHQPGRLRNAARLTSVGAAQDQPQTPRRGVLKKRWSRGLPVSCYLRLQTSILRGKNCNRNPNCQGTCTISTIFLLKAKNL